VPLVHYLDGSSVERVAETMLQRLHGAGASDAGRGDGDESAALLARLPELSDAEVDALLNQMLDEKNTP
jgi:hypothetical protein